MTENNERHEYPDEALVFDYDGTHVELVDPAPPENPRVMKAFKVFYPHSDPFGCVSYAYPDDLIPLTDGASRALEMFFVMQCNHCGHTDEMRHQHEHHGLCCGCMDLSCGMPLWQLNEERAGKGLPPITKPWPVQDLKP